jgi:hypothetical protein
MGHRREALHRQVAVSRPLFGQPKLIINGLDRTKLIDGLAKQVVLVEAMAAELAPGVAVRGALCFVDADLPLLRTLTLGGYPLLYPKALAKRISAEGPLTAADVHAVAAGLARRLPSA